MTNQLAEWANYAFTLAVKAGEKILSYYALVEEIIPEYKSDHSPLTQADKAAHEIIYQGLSHFSLDNQGPAPVLSEEGEPISFLERQAWQRYWCVDPLDGTREFLVRNNEFTVNIALIDYHQPVIGIIYVPTQKCGYLAWRGGGAYFCQEKGTRERIVTQAPAEIPLRVLVSRHYSQDRLQPWLASLGETHLISQGSALKFCSMAKGEADLFLRLSPTSEWDNAAGQCLLEEAGGQVISLEGERLSYNHSGTLQQSKFIAIGDRHFDWRKIITHCHTAG